MTDIQKNNNLLSSWATEDNKEFFPAKKTLLKLPSGYYKIKFNDFGYHLFKKENTQNAEDIKVQETNELVKEIKDFWMLEDKYKKVNFSFSKGILLYGAPGNGMSVVLNNLLQSVVKDKGIAIEIEEPEDYNSFVYLIRKSDPERKIILTINNLDYIIEKFGVIPVVDMIIKINNSDKIVYVATTSSVEKINEIIHSVPNGFNKKVKIDYPTSDERKTFIKTKLTELKNENDIKTIDKWVKDTDKFSFSNIKELVISVVLHKENYNNKLKEIIKNKESLKKFEKEDRTLGFLSL